MPLSGSELGSREEWFLIGKLVSIGMDGKRAGCASMPGNDDIKRE